MKRKQLSNKLRFEVFKRDGFKCQYCGAAAPDVKLHIDHVNPVSRGGSDNIKNLVTSCESCNLGKSDDPVILGDENRYLKNIEYPQFAIFIQPEAMRNDLKVRHVSICCNLWHLFYVNGVGENENRFVFMMDLMNMPFSKSPTTIKRNLKYLDQKNVIHFGGGGDVIEIALKEKIGDIVAVKKMIEKNCTN